MRQREVGLLMCFDAASAIKILDAIEMLRFTLMGFQVVA